MKVTKPRNTTKAKLALRGSDAEYFYRKGYRTQYDEYIKDPELRGLKKYETYKIMERDIYPVGMFYNQFRAALIQTGFHTDSDDEEENQYVKTLLGELLNYERIIDIGSALMYGYAVVEYAVEQTSRGMAVSAAQNIPQRTIGEVRVDERTNTVVQFVQSQVTPKVTLPADCVAYAVVGSQPFGEGLYSYIARDALSYLRQRPLIDKAISSNLRNNPNLVTNQDDKATEEVSAQWASLNRKGDPNTRFRLPSNLYEAQSARGDERLVTTPQHAVEYLDAIDVKKTDLSKDFAENIAHVLGVYPLLQSQDAETVTLAAAATTAFSNNIKAGVSLVTHTLQQVLDRLYEENGQGKAPKVESDNSNFIAQLDLQRTATFLMEAQLGMVPRGVIEKIVAPAGITPADLDTEPLQFRVPSSEEQNGGVDSD